MSNYNEYIWKNPLDGAQLTELKFEIWASQLATMCHHNT